MASLLQEQYGFLRNYLLKLCLSQPLAEDLAQETMIRAVESIRRFRGESAFSTWLLAIATRVYLDEKRKAARRGRKLSAYAEAERLQLAQSHPELRLELLEALASLPDEQRAAVLLKHYYGYSYEEIGELSGVAAGTAKSRVHHGLAKLRKELTVE
ncbi:sigma-70 family RNA polymerase sigma factor [Paenibacillus albicereus]|uniref:Sigma-70 family RNA polymerase sigma factor n=2 Tax=Paenibacillus albicereus TaxID=2726185 RepID=A0A6H2H167_9BACL|nr:sigma-70 family RNA polymerase sigma factor [Paenibacillus albicereus]